MPTDIQVEDKHMTPEGLPSYAPKLSHDDTLSVFDAPNTTKFPLKPLRWPTTRDEQLQTICSIKRMLNELHAYLQANSSTLIEALPRMSVSGDGLVKVSILHEWLCSLKRDQGSNINGADTGPRGSTASKDNASLAGNLTESHGSGSKGTSAVETRVEPFVQHMQQDELLEQMLHTLKGYLDPSGTGKVQAEKVLHSFRIAKRLALEHDIGSPLRGRTVTILPKPRADIEHLKKWKKEFSSLGSAPPRSVDSGGSTNQLENVHGDVTQEQNGDTASLATDFGVVREGDVHDLVDILFSDCHQPTGIVSKLNLEELEGQIRFLRRVWGINHYNRPKHSKTTDATESHSSIVSSDDEFRPDLKSKWMEMLDEPCMGEIISAVNDRTWRALVQRIAWVLASLEDYLARNEGMRFMEFVKAKGMAVLARSTPAGRDLGQVDIRLVRRSLLDLFDEPIAKRAKEWIKAVMYEREATAQAQVTQQQELRRIAEIRMKRAGIGPLFRRVETLLRRRGLRLGEAMDLVRADDKDSAIVSLEKFLALVKALHIRRPPRSFLRSRQIKSARAAAAAAAIDARATENRAFVKRIIAAEQNGVLESFARLDHYFRRYQLTADGIWAFSRSIARMSDGSNGAAGGCGTRTEALGAEQFHDLLVSANVTLPLDQVRAIVRYLDTDGNGTVEYDELNAALMDYRKFKRAKRRFEIQRARAEHRLFLDQQATLLLQFLVLMAPVRDSAAGTFVTPTAANNATSNPTSSYVKRRRSSIFDHKFNFLNLSRPENQSIHIVEMQRAIEKASYQPVSQYFREVRERLHKETYDAMIFFQGNNEIRLQHQS